MANSEVDSQNRTFFYLLVVLVTLVVADGVITRVLVSHFPARESNPFLTAWVGNDNLLVIKLIGALAAAYILWRVSKKKLRISLAVTCLFVMFYTGVLVWNLYVYFAVQHLGAI